MYNFTPANLEFVILSFEGPDQPYSQAGGLGVRVTNLTEAMAQKGFTTHLFFLGDPDLPNYEERVDGNLKLNRWCQWQSRYHRGGVYENENWKVLDYQESIPWHVTEFVVRPAIAAGKRVAVIAEDWQTADALNRLSDSLHFHGLRGECILMWNANNDMSFDRINWGRVQYTAQITAVSRYVKHQIRALGYDALVIPNGISAKHLEPPSASDVLSLKDAVSADIFFFKIGRMDPDKGWLESADAVAELKRRDIRAKLVFKGGLRELHRDEFLGHAERLGLRVDQVHLDSSSISDMAGSLGEVEADADVIDIRTFIPDDALPALYAAADGTLANSLYEPFGIVGLEAMAAGGVAYVGSTGEDYAISGQNSAVLDTGSGEEIASIAVALRNAPDWSAAIRRKGRELAALFTWDNSIEIMLKKLPLMAIRQGLEPRNAG
ncbi:MAG: glycosyltransferase family 4 protein [Chloroflexi bacterium]|nr:glycosyltransferase family 4 protein [Chloroflexota bacterium]